MKPPSVSALKWFGWTDRGKVRPHNEDSFVGLQFDAREVHRLGKVGEGSLAHNDYAFAVSDGMGGARAGEFASRIAVEKITTLLPRSYKLSALGLDAGIDDFLGELFDQIHKALVYVGNSYEECRGMETTLSLCWFTPGWMYFGHVGDSRIYFLSKRDLAGLGIKQLSQDDTHVAWLLRNGHIKEWEARTHPRRNVLQKSLGGGNQFVDPQVGAVAYEPGDMFLLCTDGLTEGLHGDHLVDLMRSSEVAETNRAQRLVEISVH
ncbi:MAG TPA: protein phosphatase 2C domain-containing protein, partial [Candidatus Limnocylindria bacterium]|nr:protein phosphatase 2C domain-containing protein [Candidatus Limnocylindria bacterium]